MGDNISRQAAMAYPLSWEHYDKEHGDKKFICGVESYREYIEHLPSADRWIPVSEKLPEEEGEYIACSGNGSIAILHYNTIQTMSYPQGFSKVSEETGWSWRQPNIVAWMPLPEPYREEAEDDPR